MLVLSAFLPGGAPAGSPWVTASLAMGLWAFTLTLGRRSAQKALHWT